MSVGEKKVRETKLKATMQFTFSLQHGRKQRSP